MPEYRNLLWLLLFVLGISISALIASFVVSGFNLFHLLPRKFPGRDKLMEIAAAYHLYARHWVATFFAFAASLAAHLATCTTFLCVASAFHAGVKLTDFFALLPVTITLTALPPTFAGVGLREL